MAPGLGIFALAVAGAAAVVAFFVARARSNAVLGFCAGTIAGITIAVAAEVFEVFHMFSQLASAPKDTPAVIAVGFSLWNAALAGVAGTIGAALGAWARGRRRL